MLPKVGKNGGVVNFSTNRELGEFNIMRITSDQGDYGVWVETRHGTRFVIELESATPEMAEDFFRNLERKHLVDYVAALKPGHNCIKLAFDASGKLVT